MRRFPDISVQVYLLSHFPLREAKCGQAERAWLLGKWGQVGQKWKPALPSTLAESREM